MTDYGDSQYNIEVILERARKAMELLASRQRRASKPHPENCMCSIDVARRALADIGPSQEPKEWRVVWGESNNNQFWSDASFVGTEANADSFVAARTQLPFIRKQSRTKEIPAGPWMDIGPSEQEKT